MTPVCLVGGWMIRAVRRRFSKHHRMHLTHSDFKRGLNLEVFRCDVKLALLAPPHVTRRYDADDYFHFPTNVT